MTPSEEIPVVRFLFDHHVSGPALRQLRAKGIDVLHVSEAGLAEADDADIFLWAGGAGRIVVTRNYRDFAPLVEAFARRGEAFPGVLFLASSLLENDPGAHVRALEAWVAEVRATGVNPAHSSMAWLAPVERRGSDG